MIKITNGENEQTILTVLEGLNWSGAKDMGCRTLEFSFLYNPLVKDIPKYKVQVGDKVEWIEEGRTLFLGYVEILPYNTEDDTISVTCQDLLSRVMRSKFVGRMRGTLNELCNNICGSFGIKNGVNVENPHIHNIVSTGDLSYYDVLNTALMTMFERYTLYMDGDTLKLAEHDVIDTFEIGKNIRSSNFSQSMSDMVTKVLIIDNDGNLLNAVESPEDLQKYGLFQEVYNYNKDCKNNLAEAQKLLKGVTNAGGIVVNNNNNCIAGRFIKVIEPVNSFEGVFEIQTDRHIIETGNPYMELEIKHVTNG